MALLEKYFNRKDLIQIRDVCTEAEKTTAGEIRVSIFSKRPKQDKQLELKELALKEFQSLGMDKTRDKTGILLFLLLKEKKFQILADKGINDKVPQEVWDGIAAELVDYFKKKEYLTGIKKTVGKMGKILTEHFPIKADDTNELSDEVHVI